MSKMSALDRSELISELKDTDWDLIIIGGGITGAGILLDGVTRGLKTILIEKQDFAWGTSSRSTKLIHGGLRYLKQLEIGLVREVGMERAIVYKNARHIVRPERMLLPIVENGSLGKTTSAIGLWIYDWLADVDKEERRIMLTREETLKAEEKLNADILIGGGLYYEYRTDDARLTIEIIKKAVELGGAAINYAEVSGFIYQNEQIVGVKMIDCLKNENIGVNGKCVVNATGPWVDKVRKLDEPMIRGKRLQLTKGVHLVVPKEKLNLNQSVYFDVAEDGRMIFCIPRAEIVYMGTTDTMYESQVDQPTTTMKDVKYILTAVNHMFPGTDLKPTDIISTWAGLRPLIHEDGKDPSELSRKDEIFISKRGLISIAGGKLTGYRKMSERILKEIKKKNEQFGIEQDIGPSQSKEIPVSGNTFGSEEEMSAHLDALINKAKEHEHRIKQLFFRYGSNTDQIIEMAQQHTLNEGTSFEQALIFAEVDYAIKNEMVLTMSDFCIRRTGMLYFDPIRLIENLEQIADAMQEILGWSNEKKDEEMRLVRLAHRMVLDFQD